MNFGLSPAPSRGNKSLLLVYFYLPVELTLQKFFNYFWYCNTFTETYLLEKSRITFQQEVERSYHIFYQMMQKAVPDLKAKCLLSNDIYDYHYVSQGKTSVPSIDDNEDLEFTHEAFNILHFTEEETYNIYKCVSAVMNMGELVS